jgi:hypothetical protein
MELKPWCNHHLCALTCEPEETDCLWPAADGWYQVDLSHWTCTVNEQWFESGDEEWNECGDSWVVICRAESADMVVDQK